MEPQPRSSADRPRRTATARRRRHAARRLGPLAVLALWPAGLGCYQFNPEVADLRRENLQLKEQLAAAESAATQRDRTLERLNTELRTARGFGPEDRGRIFFPTRLKFASLTGGADYDNRPGDDGVTVYLQPVDDAGDVLKVAGDARVQLFDLAGGGRLLGDYQFPVEEIASHWFGKLLTQHYTLKCPWQNGPPAHPEVTIRVEFRDYLTRNIITAQTVCTVRLGEAPASQPAAGN